MSVPNDALEPRVTYGGAIPTIALHRRGDVFVQESSYSFLWIAGLMFGLAVGSILWNPELPLEAVHRVNWELGGVFVCVDLAVMAAYFFRNVLGLTVTIDPDRKALYLKRRKFVEEVPWCDVVELQICNGWSPKILGPGGYQLILTRRNSAGEWKRDLLVSHLDKDRPLALARRYRDLCGFPVVDYSERSESLGVAS